MPNWSKEMMKRNSKVAVVFILATMLLLSGCNTSGKTMTPNSEDEALRGATVETVQTEKPSGSEKEDISPDISREDSQEIDVSSFVSEGDFEYFDNGDGTCAVLSCDSEASVIDVPEKISGLTVTSIEDYAFSSLSVEAINLPDTVESLGMAAFFSCENLKTVELGSGLKQVGNKSFMECPALETVTFPDGLKTIEYAFGTCASLREVYIPASATEIGGIALLMFCPNIIVVTPAGSVAEQVAIESGLPVRNP